MGSRASVSGIVWTLLLALGLGCSNKGGAHPAKGGFGGGAPQSGGAATSSSPVGGAGGTGAANSSSSHGGSSGGSAVGGAGGGPATPAADDDAGSANAGNGAPNQGLPRTMVPIDPPVTDDCITDVKAGDHTFTCGGLTFLVMVDEMCTHFACGLIFDIHGATMSGAQMRDNTLLYKIAPSKGYLVVNPSATASNTGGTWDLTANPPTVADFMDRMIKAFHVDPNRVHVTGFSQGSAMTFWFLCNKKDILASAAPVSGATDVSCLSDSWKPRVPILYENGQKDMASVIANARTMIDSLTTQLMLTGGTEIAGDGHYSRKHWEGDGGMALDYIEHDYGGQPVLDGHCIPGGVDISGSGMNNFGLNATTCTTGMIAINWGELALQWFIDHPKQ